VVTSVYFNNHKYRGEQSLLEDLVIESIKQYGIDVHYLPKTINNLDKIYGEDAISSYDSNYMIDMYVKNVEGFGGQGDFLSKFNLQIRDQMTLTVARRTFEEEVGQYEQITRPREGDLIFFPLNNKIFEITFIEHEPVFYQLGALQMYDIVCELFEYNNERFNTGLVDVDSLQKELTTNMVEFGIMSSTGFSLISSNGYPVVHSGYNYDEQEGDVFADNDELQVEADGVIDWSSSDPFSEKGRF